MINIVLLRELDSNKHSFVGMGQPEVVFRKHALVDDRNRYGKLGKLSYPKAEGFI